MAQELTIKMNADGSLVIAAAKQVETALDGVNKSANTAAVGMKSMGDTAAASFGKTEISAKQTAAAMRGLPAQFTDIFVSLQAGQSPMTVLFQQGGQLKDMFGGVGNAARAMAGYVAGMANPFTVAAAAIGAVGIAYYQGSQEADAFRLALTNTGNAAGISASEMAGLASVMGSSWGQTIGQSAEALAAMAATGQVGRASLQQFAQTAVDMEKTTGQSIDATAKIFADLGREPVAASAKLNQSLNYLSAATYAQIKAAADLGETEKAAALAQEAYSKAMDGRTQNLTQNLGYIESAWKGVKNVARETWDTMLGVGRDKDVATELEKARAKLQANLDRQKTTGADSMFAPILERDAATLRAQIENLGELERMNKKAGMAAAERTASEKAGIAAIDALGKFTEQAMTKQERMNKELAEYRKLLKEDSGAGKRTAEQIAKEEAAIRDKYKEKAPGGASAGESALIEAAAKIKANDAYLASLYELGAAAEKQTATELALGKVNEELAGKITGTARANKEALKASLEKQIAQEKEIATEKSNIKVLEDIAKANYEARMAAIKRADALTEQVNKERESVAAIGLSKEAVADLQYAKYQDAAASKDRLAVMADESDASGLLGAAYRKEADSLRELASLKREGALKQTAVDAAKKAEDAWIRTAQTINQSLTDALMRGFEAGKSFAQNLRDTLKNMFNTLVLRPVIQAVVGGVTGLGGASASAGGGDPVGTFNALKGIYNTGSATMAVGSQWMAGTMSSANAAGTLGANMTGTGIDGLLASNGAYGTAGSTASGVGAAGTMLGGALVGFMAGKMISGGYSVMGKSGNAAVAAGTAIGAVVGGPIGAAIGGAIGGVVNRAFGMGAKNVTGEGIAGTFSTQGASVQGYTDWQQKGGWFRSDKSGRDYQAVGSELDQFLDGALSAVTQASKSYATTLGLNADALNGFSKSVDISLKGLDAAGQEKAIANALGGFGDSLAQQLLGTFETVTTSVRSGFRMREVVSTNWIAGPFVRAGETAGQALARLGTSLQGVNGILGTLNQNLLATSLAGGDAASKLADLFGGLQGMQQATTAYFQAYYSDAERNAKATEQLSVALGAMGLQLPTTLSGWRALVDAQDLTTESGRQTYASLINLAPAFKSVTDSIATTVKSLTDSVSGFFASLKSSVASARQGVAGAVAGIQTAAPLDAAQIQSAIASTALTRPQLQTVNASVGERVQSATARMGAAGQSAAAAKTAYEQASSSAASVEAVRAQMQAQWSSLNSEAQAVFPNWNNWSYRVRWHISNEVLPAMAQLEQGIAAIGPQAAASAALAGNALAAHQAAQAEVAASTAEYNAAAAAQTSAQQAVQAAYAAAVSKYVADAAKSVDKLSKLREDTVAYYNAQKALADGMLASAGNLRQAAAAMRTAQLTAAETLLQQQTAFDQAYTLALSTTGTVQAGYADKMAAGLQGLSDSLKNTSATREDWALATAKLYAQSQAVANKLEANAPKDYQAESLAMLGSIDSALAAVEAAAQSSEKIISDAIYATGAKNIAGLRAVVAALTGQTVPGFAEGGYTGQGRKHEVAGLVHRGEVVWSQADVARAGGVGAVQQLRAGLAPLPAAMPMPAAMPKPAALTKPAAMPKPAASRALLALPAASRALRALRPLLPSLPSLPSLPLASRAASAAFAAPAAVQASRAAPAPLPMARAQWLRAPASISVKLPAAASAKAQAPAAMVTAKLYAQTQALAKKLDVNAPQEYQADALAVLGSIDAALVAVQSATEASEKIISDAINTASAKNIAGLQTVAASLTDQTVPGFAEGGYTGQTMPGFAQGGYTGQGRKHEVAGLVHRGEVVWSQADVARAGGVSTVQQLRAGLVPSAVSDAVSAFGPAADLAAPLAGSFVGSLATPLSLPAPLASPEMQAAAPYAPSAYTPPPQFVAAGDGGGANTAQLAAELAAMREQLDGNQRALNAIALNTMKTHKILDRVSDGGEALQTKAVA